MPTSACCTSERPELLNESGYVSTGGESKAQKTTRFDWCKILLWGASVI
jgi:hypothetical protein